MELALNLVVHDNPILQPSQMDGLLTMQALAVASGVGSFQRSMAAVSQIAAALSGATLTPPPGTP